MSSLATKASVAIRYLGASAIAGIVVLTFTRVGGAQTPPWLPSVRPSGQSVMPVFEGWYRNRDGTFTLQFGYFSRNSEEVVHIPPGPDNFVVPTAYDGRQPTRFLPQPQDRGPGRGIRYWGVFTVTVPADFGEGEVVWTLRSRGRSVSVPGHVRSTSYELDPAPAAVSDGPPVLRFDPSGPEGKGPSGVEVRGLHARVGARLELSVQVGESGSPVTLRWFEHRGPGTVSFPDGRVNANAEGGLARTYAVFGEPGEYVVRVLATNLETEFDRYCCWTNGYIHITVTD